MVEVLPSIREHIVRSPDTCGGQPRIEGTRIRVKEVAICHVHLGMSPAEMVEQWPHVTLAGIHAALAYYYAHHEAFEAEIAADDAWYEEQKAKAPSLLRDGPKNREDAGAADDPVPSR